jgi:hypothetical protein
MVLRGRNDVKFKGVFSAVAALSLVVVPTLGAAAPVAPRAKIATPLTNPAPEKVTGDSAISGSGIIIALLALAAVVGGALAAGSSTKTPTSA